MSKLSFRARALDVAKSMPVVLYVPAALLSSTAGAAVHAISVPVRTVWGGARLQAMCML